jgi:hypothetical protein
VARRMEAIFYQDLEHSRQVEYKGWRRRGLVDRALELLTIPIRDQL